MAYNSRVQFVDIQLDAKQKEALRKWYSEQDGNFDPVVNFLDLDYKITVSWDNQNQCFACYVIPNTPDHHNSGCILTSRAGDWHKAVMAAYWRSEVLKKGNWAVSKRERGQTDDFDLG